ncbi:MAG: hypothetical protein ACKVIQ_15635 [Acidimicrobiales bacterium]
MHRNVEERQERLPKLAHIEHPRPVWQQADLIPRQRFGDLRDGIGLYADSPDIGSSALDCTAMHYLYEVMEEMGWRCGYQPCRW